MSELRLNVQKHKRLLWIMVLGYTVFNGCVVFPFSNEMFPFDFSKALLFMVGYGMIGILYAGLLDHRKGISVLLLTVLLTLVGIMGRFLLEFGEVSNSMNFTPLNLVLFLTIIPIYCTMIYWSIWKWYDKISVI